MPAKTSKQPHLNLLPDEHNANSPLSRTITWATGVGRVVIIFTELIVVSAFLSRFYLDRKNADLSEIIRQQQAVLASVKDFELEFINTQKRLSLIRNLKDQSPNFATYIDLIGKQVPTDLVLKQLQMHQTTNQVTANLLVMAYRESALVTFVQNLSKEPNISSVDVVKIDKKPKMTSYDIGLNLTFNSTKNAKSSH